MSKKKPTPQPASKPLMRRAAPVLAAGLIMAAGGCVGVYAGESVGVQIIPDGGEPGTGDDAGVNDAGQN